MQRITTTTGTHELVGRRIHGSFDGWLTREVPGCSLSVLLHYRGRRHRQRKQFNEAVSFCVLLLLNCIEMLR